MPHPLHALSQQIHSVALPARLLLVTSVAGTSSGTGTGTGTGSGAGEDGQDGRLTVCLLWSASEGGGVDGDAHAKTGGDEEEGEGAKGVRVWASTSAVADLQVPSADIQAAIQGGMLHVDFKRRAADVDLLSIKSISLQILTQPRNTVFELQEAPLEAYAPVLLGAQFRLLSAQAAPRNNSAEIKDLRAKLSQRDTEIISLNNKLAAAHATVVRQAASSSQQSAPANSPQKPPKAAPKNASKLQPNQKRRRVKGSDSDDDW